jgi:hypothetical protein
MNLGWAGGSTWRSVSGAGLGAARGLGGWLEGDLVAEGFELGHTQILHNRGWLRVGANRDVNGNPGTFDAHLKGYLKRQAADYIVVVLERAGIIELDRDLPARVRLSI